MFSSLQFAFPKSTTYLCRTWPIPKRVPWMHSLHTQRPGRSSAWLFGVPRLGVPPGRVVVIQPILSAQHEEPTRAVGSEMICQSNPDPFSRTILELINLARDPKISFHIYCGSYSSHSIPTMQHGNAFV